MRTMYDGISPLRLPTGADLYAGYDDGRWPDAQSIYWRFPGKRVVRITTDPADRIGDVLDVERGDAMPTDIVAWLLARRQLGAWPSVYCSAYSWSLCIKYCTDAHLAQPPWWIAHYGIPKQTIPISAIALQYQSNLGYDVSVVRDYWPGIDPRPTNNNLPTKPTTERMQSMEILSDGRAVVKCISSNTHLLVFTSIGAFDGSPTQQWSVQDLSDQVAHQTNSAPTLVKS